MTPRPEFHSVASRRRQAQRRIAANRAVVGDAWIDFERASVEGQARVHRVIDRTRTVAAVAGAIGVVLAVRRLLVRRNAAPALGAMAVAGALRRLLAPALRRYLRRP